MAEKPVVHDSATRLGWGVGAIAAAVVAWLVGANTRTEVLGLVSVVLLVLGVVWLTQSFIASARNRDAVARAMLEKEDREGR